MIEVPGEPHRLLRVTTLASGDVLVEIVSTEGIEGDEVLAAVTVTSWRAAKALRPRPTVVERG